MTPLVIKYPLDPTGVNPDNRVVGERHTMEHRRVRAIATKHGAFFEDSLVLTDPATGKVLVEGTQYYASELYSLPSERYGKGIYAIILVVDPLVPDTVDVSYQALGGEFSSSAEAIINMINNLNLDNRQVAWPDIYGKPDKFYPSKHLHDIGDVYGFEYIVMALQGIERAIILGDTASHDAIYQYIDDVVASIKTLIGQTSGAINAHIGDKGNPHGTTAAQVGAYTKAEADMANMVQTQQLMLVINANAANFENHRQNTGNPHNTTAAQVGAYDYAAIDAKLATINGAIAAVQQSLSNLINNPDPYAQYLTAARGNARYVKQGGGANQGTNQVLIGYDARGTGKTLLTIDATDFGAIAMEAWTSAQINTIKNTVVNYFGAIPATYVGESIYVRGVGAMEWTSVYNFTGYRCIEVGTPIYGTARTPKAYELDLTGGLAPKAAYYSLWAWANENSFVTDTATWQNNPHRFLFADHNADYFRLPDMRNMFYRATGWDYDTGGARNVGEYLSWTMQSHTHNSFADTQGNHRHGSGWGESQPGDNRHGIYSTVRGVGSGRTDYDNFDNATSTDGAHTHNIRVDATGSVETRPESVAFIPRIHI